MACGYSEDVHFYYDFNPILFGSLVAEAPYSPSVRHHLIFFPLSYRVVCRVWSIVWSV
jgi:hypothetical protein